MRSVQKCIAPHFVIKGDKNLASKVKTLCEEKVVPVIENLGYEVVEVEYAKKNDGMNLTFFIDKEEGVKIEDCEKVSKEIDSILDGPLKTERDFKRNEGKLINITLFAKINGQKIFEGKLKGFDSESVTIEIKDQLKTFKKETIAHIVPVIDFNQNKGDKND